MSFSTQPAVRLTVLVDDTDVWHHKPVHSEIVHRAHAAGLTGASTFHGMEGLITLEPVQVVRFGGAHAAAR
ncbi:hypothetical protein M877_21380 [Streptomyces niveus NCIMB 11891]|nr:hypothetical protein M877_21380 [Streptomyces niveus NCIMB 11891]